jgi:hypothetical protein
MDNKSRLILCPSYERLEGHDVLKLVSFPEVLENIKQVVPVLTRYWIIDAKQQSTTYGILSTYYSSLGKMYKSMASYECVAKDTFWFNMLTYVNDALNKGLEKDTLAKYINNKLIYKN